MYICTQTDICTYVIHTLYIYTYREFSLAPRPFKAGYPKRPTPTGIVRKLGGIPKHSADQNNQHSHYIPTEKKNMIFKNRNQGTCRIGSFIAMSSPDL